jgi:23S rRNA pseudouridine1911/1915/1917 synthase
MNPIITVLHEDNHVLGVLKPAGLLAQGDRTGDPTALAQVREYIRVTYGKPGEAFVGLVHRIDRPVSGVMVFARTSKAASRLARAFHDRTVEKSYLAVVIGEMPAARGDLAGFVARDHTRSRMTYADRSGARDAALSYRVLGAARLALPPREPRGRAKPVERTVSLLQVSPRTGRHHQIRLQLSSAGHPIVGDVKYRAPEGLPGRVIALHAACLRVPHPVREDVVTLAAPPEATTPWTLFGEEIAAALTALTAAPPPSPE